MCATGGRPDIASNPRAGKANDRTRNGWRFERRPKSRGDDRREHVELCAATLIRGRQIACCGGVGEELLGRGIGATGALDGG